MQIVPLCASATGTQDPASAVQNGGYGSAGDGSAEHKA
jgi:hypothetical protein